MTEKYEKAWRRFSHSTLEQNSAARESCKEDLAEFYGGAYRAPFSSRELYEAHQRMRAEISRWRKEHKSPMGKAVGLVFAILAWLSVATVLGTAVVMCYDGMNTYMDIIVTGGVSAVLCFITAGSLRDWF